MLYLSAVHSDTLQGLLVSHGDGIFTYDPAGAFADLGAGEMATDVFSYTVRDEGGNTATATVTITVSGGTDDSARLYLPIILNNGSGR